MRRKEKMLLVIVLGAILCGAECGSPAPASDQAAKDVVAAFVEATGGREAHRAVEDHREELSVVTRSEGGEKTATVVCWFKHPNLRREDWELDAVIADRKLRFSQVCTGEERRTSVVSAEWRPTMPLMASEPYAGDWQERGYVLFYRGEGAGARGEACHAIDVARSNSKEEFRCLFNRETGLLEKKLWRSDGPDLAPPPRSDLGWVRKDSPLVKPLLDAVFALPVGQVSEPVRTRYGWHLLLVTKARRKRHKRSRLSLNRQKCIAEATMRQSASTLQRITA